jgi:L-lactate utilization protein LutB
MLAERYWRIRLAQVKEALEANDFAVFIAQDQVEAKEIVLQRIIPQAGAKRISAGDSMTCISMGLFEALANEPGVEFIEPFPEELPFDEMMGRLRKALLVDLFITGTNAVTEAGQLVNLDMVGNRIGGITFGPKEVAILVGRNKVVATLEDGMERIRNYVAPANAARLDRRTPCAKTAHCEDCSSSDRICNAWSILEKSYPKGRVTVVLINQDLGL